MKSSVTEMRWKIILLVASTLLMLITMEIVYRVRLYSTAGPETDEDSNINFRVIPRMYVLYDEKHGEKFRPNSELWASYVIDGRLVYGTLISRSNSDGLGGKTTIGEYQKADHKILVFGDSFTHWNQHDSTWPDLLQNRLTQSSGKKVAVLNYARGTYGVLQMLSLASEKVRELRPDEVIIAVTGDDFSRDRWWCNEIEWHGFKRWMISSRKDNFADYRYAVDEFLIVPAATREWCQEALRHSGNEDTVLAEAERQFVEIRNDVEKTRKQLNLFSLTESFLFNRIAHGWPYRYVPYAIPRVEFSDYAEDDETVAACQDLRHCGVPVLLVYLPTKLEVEEHDESISRQESLLMHSLERMLSAEFIYLQNQPHHNDPGKIDLQPYDSHPNYQGLVFYAETVAEFMMRSDHPPL